MDSKIHFKPVEIVLLVAAVAVYLISSPRMPEEIQPHAKASALEAAEPVAAAVVMPQETSSETPADVEPYPEPEPQAVAPVPVEPPIQFIEIVDSCGPYFNGSCVNARSGPSVKIPAVGKLRTGVVLRVAEVVEMDDATWYKIDFTESVRYPERITGDWYVNANYTRSFYAENTEQLAVGQTASTSKKIIVNLSKQTLRAYDGDALFMEQKVSTGVSSTPTPRGTFTIFKKTPSRYMQGPIPGSSAEYYDLPGVPWDLYFTTGGAIIHGAYWHNDFGHVHSHGCINLPVDKAEELYNWTDLGTALIVQD